MNIIEKRNRVMFYILLVLIVGLLTLNIAMGEPLRNIITIAGIGIPTLLFVYITVFKYKTLNVISMYILVGNSFIMLNVLLFLTPRFDTMLFIFLVMIVCTIYQRKDIILFSTVASNATILWFYFINKDTIFVNELNIPIIYFFFILIMMGIFMYYQSAISETLRIKAEENEKKSKSQNVGLTEAINEIVKSVDILETFTRKLNQKIHQTKTSSDFIMNNYQDVVSNLKKENEAIEEISQNTGEIHNSVEKVSKSAESLKISSKTTKKVTMDGYDNVELLITSTTKVTDSVEKSFDVIKGLESKMKDVNHILNAISDVSNQTNLLALNASIEAARAGEHGKGFMVVADEVKKLSIHTNTLTNEIQTILNNFRKQMEAVTKHFKGGIDEIKTNETYLTQVRKSFDEVREQTVDVLSQSELIESMIQKVTESTKVMTDEIGHLNSLSDSTSEKSFSTLKEIKTQNETIDYMVEQLKLIENQTKNLKEFIE